MHVRVGALAAAEVCVGRSGLIGTWRAPAQPRGAIGPRQGERGLGRPHPPPKHSPGWLEEPPADIAKNAILHVAKIS